MMRAYVPVHGLGPAPMRRPLAFTLAYDSCHTRHDGYCDIYHARRQTQQVTTVRTNNAVAVHQNAVDGEGRFAGTGLVADAKASA